MITIPWLVVWLVVWLIAQTPQVAEWNAWLISLVVCAALDILQFARSR